MILATFAITFLVCAIAVPPLRVHAQAIPTTVPLADYVAEIETAAQLLATDPSAESVQLAQEQLQAITQVSMPDGTLVAIEPLLGTDAATRPTAADAQKRLTLVSNQLRAADGDDAVARLGLLTAIFERAAFVQQDSLWQRFWRWLRSWLPNLPTDEVNGQSGWWALVVNWAGYLIIGVGALLLVYLLSLWLQNLLGGFVGGAANGRRLTPDGELLSAAEARQQAHQLASSGSFREAVRRLYLAALLRLDERDLLHYDRSNTNREVLSTVRDNPTLYQRLRPVVEIFDDVWYGIHEPDQASFDRYVQAVEKLEERP